MYAARLAARTTATAATLLAALTLSTPTAHAGEHPGPAVHATPGNAQPGQTIQLTLTCPTEAAAVADGTSQAGTIIFGVATSGVFTGTLQVHSSTPAGQYTITANCSAGPPAGKPVTATTTVVITGRPVTAPVHTGLGGATTGPDTTRIAAGTTLTAAALGTGVWILRRRATTR